MAKKILQSKCCFLSLLFVCFWARAADEVNTAPIKISITPPFSDYGSKVLPTGQHWLNVLAKEAELEIPNLQVVFANDYLSSIGGLGGFLGRINTLLLHESASYDPALMTILFHELIHARYDQALRNRSPVLFSGYVENKNPAMQLKLYGRGFRLDEVPATLYSIMDYTENLRALWQRDSQAAPPTISAELRNAIQLVQGSVDTFTTMMTTLQQALGSPASASPVAAPEAAKYLSEEIKWVGMGTEHTKAAFTDNVSKANISLMHTFAQEILPKLKSLSAECEKVQNTALQSNLDTVKNVVASVESIAQSFREAFPQDMEIVESTERKFSVGRERIQLRSLNCKKLVHKI